MRKINSILAVIALCVIVSVSCKKDNPAPAAPAYIGSWKETNFVASGCTDSNDNEVHACPAAECESIIFTTTTITLVKPGSANQVLNYTANGSTLTVTMGSSTITVTVTVSGSTLTLSLQNSAADGGCLNVTTYAKI